VGVGKLEFENGGGKLEHKSGGELRPISTPDLGGYKPLQV